MLAQVFAVAGPVQHVTLVPAPHQQGGPAHGFVQFDDMSSAQTALQMLDGRNVCDEKIRLSWAYQGSRHEEDRTTLFVLSISNLGLGVTNEVLRKVFSMFGRLGDVQVMRDMDTGELRGRALVAFYERADACRAISGLNSKRLDSHTISVRWARPQLQGSDEDGSAADQS
jgi:nucleolysin TIA-1/TIAR